MKNIREYINAIPKNADPLEGIFTYTDLSLMEIEINTAYAAESYSLQLTKKNIDPELAGIPDNEKRGLEGLLKSQIMHLANQLRKRADHA